MIFELLSLVAIVAFFALTLARKSRKGPSLPPGPTSLPIIGHLHLIGPLIHRTFDNLASRYGPLMNIKLGSISVIVVSSPELAREFLKTHEINFSMRPITIAIDYLTFDNMSFAFAPYGPYWKFMKKLSTVELLGTRMMGEFRPTRTEELHGLLGLLRQKSQDRGIVNVSQELLRFANNVICQMMMGIRASGTEGEAEVARGLARDGFKRRSEDIRRRFDNLLEGIMTEREKVRDEERRRNGGGKPRVAVDFLDLMLDVIEDEAAEFKLTRDHFKALALNFFFFYYVGFLHSRDRLNSHVTRVGPIRTNQQPQSPPKGQGRDRPGRRPDPARGRIRQPEPRIHQRRNQGSLPPPSDQSNDHKEMRAGERDRRLPDPAQLHAVRQHVVNRAEPEVLGRSA
ncbi:Cytochrome P450 93B2 [Linum perenne]